MSREKVFNFSAGPSVMPEAVLEKAQKELMDFGSCGLSVMEMSHRSKMFQDIHSGTKQKLKEVLNVPDSHEILFLQGGASLQFAAIPMNILRGGTADYAITGNFSNKAAKEAEKYGTVNIACSSKDQGHNYIPSQQEIKETEGAEYFYYCSNNTIFGTQWQYVPEVKSALVSDMSSDILSRPVDFSKHSLIFAGAQKNMAPAGLTVVILDKNLAGREQPYTPQVMSYQEQIKNDSMLNTPPCWCIYMLGLTLDWLKEQGGIAGMEQLKKERSAPLYEFLDNSRIFIPHARKDSRSDMNITFRTGDEDLDAEFVKGAAARGLLNLKGHKSVGGMRASLYNAMPVEGVKALLEYMKEFEVTHHV